MFNLHRLTVGGGMGSGGNPAGGICGIGAGGGGIAAGGGMYDAPTGSD